MKKQLLILASTCLLLASCNEAQSSLLAKIANPLMHLLRFLAKLQRLKLL